MLLSDLDDSILFIQILHMIYGHLFSALLGFILLLSQTHQERNI